MFANANDSPNYSDCCCFSGMMRQHHSLYAYAASSVGAGVCVGGGGVERDRYVDLSVI